MGTFSFKSVPYMHELDRRAFELLQAKRNFKKYYQAYDDSAAAMDHLKRLSTAVKLGPDQMPEIYNLLPPICHILKISVPDLYLVIDKEMDCWATGDKNPYICVTDALVKKLSAEMISSVLAHECGHIACHHLKYSALCRQMLIEKKPTFIEKITGESKKREQDGRCTLLNSKRCSEFSADRAAVLCDGDPEKLVDMLLRLEGYGDDISRDAFIRQTLELRRFVDDSIDNARMEFRLQFNEDHPFLATRIYEVYKWVETDEYRKLRETAERRKKQFFELHGRNHLQE